MSREQALHEIHEVLKIALKHDGFTLTESTTAKDIMGWDSLSHIIIIAAIEKHFGITFSFMDILSMTDIGKIVDCLQSKLP